MRYAEGGRVTARDNIQDDQQRVVLIKPGDTLLIGNIGDVTPEIAQAVSDALRAMGFSRNVLFAEDIDVSKLPARPNLRETADLFGPKIEEAR